MGRRSETREVLGDSGLDKLLCNRVASMVLQILLFITDFNTLNHPQKP